MLFWEQQSCVAAINLLQNKVYCFDMLSFQSYMGNTLYLYFGCHIIINLFDRCIDQDCKPCVSERPYIHLC